MLSARQAAQSPTGSKCTACPASLACGGGGGDSSCFSVAGGDDAACPSGCVLTLTGEDTGAKYGRVYFKNVLFIGAQADLAALAARVPAGCAVDGHVSLPHFVLFFCRVPAFLFASRYFI